MKVVGIAGYSGAGKTTLMEGLIPALKSRGLRVSVVKHAHHPFDIDHPGKDSWRHRQAGAFEVVVASDRRLALMREFERESGLTAHQLIAELSPQIDWVLVEGFKQSDLLKIEVWRPDLGQPAHHMDDDFIVAIATDVGQILPQATPLQVLDLNDPESVAAWLVDQGERFDYRVELYA
jgi:molybdopterin-guanine dinucleotide biosynthesis protein B